MNLGPIKIKRKDGSESFSKLDNVLNFKTIDFWKWSASDLLSNATRGILAEYIVAKDLGVSNGVRNEWDAFDLKTKSGLRIEVKSSAYLQSWHQEKYSNIIFSIKPSRAWDYETNKFEVNSLRQNDFYVFCLLHHKDKETVDPLNLDQWTFYVISTQKLNHELGDQKSLSLSRLLKLNPAECMFGDISKKITNLKK